MRKLIALLALAASTLAVPAVATAAEAPARVDVERPVVRYPGSCYYSQTWYYNGRISGHTARCNSGYGSFRMRMTCTNGTWSGGALVIRNAYGAWAYPGGSSTAKCSWGWWKYGAFIDVRNY